LQVVAGVDLGGTAINYTLLDQREKFHIEGLCEHPALAKEGPQLDSIPLARPAQRAGSVPEVPQTLSILSGRGLTFVRAWHTS
jgi:hypothetical protein